MALPRPEVWPNLSDHVPAHRRRSFRGCSKRSGSKDRCHCLKWKTTSSRKRGPRFTRWIRGDAARTTTVKAVRRDRCQDVTNCVFVTAGTDSFSGEIPRSTVERGMGQKHDYKGYTFSDETAVMEDGYYRARVAVMTLGEGRVRSQRFIDLETFPTEENARRRAVEAARAWIDDEHGKDRLALPTNFSPL